MSPKLKRRLGVCAGLAVTVVMLWYCTRDVEFAQCRAALARYHFIWLIPAFVVFYTSMFLRAVRWGLLFKPGYDFSGPRMFPPTMICFAFNSILPGRVGEFVRAWIVGRRFGTGVPLAMATVVAERILDAITMLGMMMVALASMPPIPAGFEITEGGFTIRAATLEKGKTSLMVLCVVLITGVILFLIPLTQRILSRIIEAAPLVPKGIKVKVADMVRAFHQGFGALTQPGAMVKIILLSLAVWLMTSASIMIQAWGFDLNMNFAQAVAMMVLIGLAVSIPASPGYWGPFEAGGIFSLFVLGVVKPEQRALAFTLTVLIHLMQYLPIIAIGMFFAWRMGVKPASGAAAEAEAAS